MRILGGEEWLGVLGIFKHLGIPLVYQPEIGVHVRMCPPVGMVNYFKTSLLVLMAGCVYRTGIFKKHLWSSKVQIQLKMDSLCS